MFAWERGCGAILLLMFVVARATCHVTVVT
jgi:hypothetical protein